jgi:alanyl-tRNA synthetase
MTSKEILEKYINFYKDRGHAVIPNVSLIPENDPTLLFVNSGMFPLVPYLSGESHPLGKRLVNVQRCIRMEDLDEIGDPIHTLAFHMIGNWSLGDYFKTEQLPWVYEFLIEVLRLDPKKLVATVFAGDKDAPKDTESIEIIKNIFAKYHIEAKLEEHIWLYSKKQGNWWQRGDAIGELGGPSSEVFYYLGKDSPKGKSPEKHEHKFVEIGNSVFMEYKKTVRGWQKLPQSNVDFGGGLERLAQAVQNKQDIFETDNFWPIIKRIEKLSVKSYSNTTQTKKNMRILADHIRGSVFLAMDGITPSNKDQGYILRRLLRRMVRVGRALGINKNISVNLVEVVCQMFAWFYPGLPGKKDEIEQTFAKEETKFRKILISGANQSKNLLNKVKGPTPEDLARIGFGLYQSIGYPFEMFLEDIKDHGITTNPSELTKIFDNCTKAHQALSRKGAEHKFKGGLADQEETTIKYHTTTHLLHMALREVLGNHVTQQGSNITGERLRFDFSHAQRLTQKEVQQVTDLVNSTIRKNLPVKFEMLPKEEAKQKRALGLFEDKYGDTVKVYYIGNSIDSAVSAEFCGGPHAQNTAELSPIEIYKQDKIGDGKMRIYAKFTKKEANFALK